MTIDALVAMLSCIEVDGRNQSHAIVEDDEAKHAPKPSRGAAPLLKRITLENIGKSELLVLPDKAKGKSGVMSPLLSTSSGKDQNRSCDGLLIRVCEPRADGVIPIELGYFDLKSGNPTGYSGQFLSTRCFVQGYVITLLSAFYGKQCEVVRERFIIFHTDKSDKVPSMQKKRSMPIAASACTFSNAEKYIVKNEQTIPAYRILS